MTTGDEPTSSQRTSRIIILAIFGLAAFAMASTIWMSAGPAPSTSGDQCAKPVAERTGGWTCPDGSATAVPSARP